jgi:MSHA biogenesis protein MshP
MFSKSQQGFTLVTAIFSLVVLAGLGAFMTTISLNQQIGSTLDFIGAKAYKAARSGTEWGVVSNPDYVERRFTMLADTTQ